MRLTINRNDLWRGIASVLDTVSAKPSLPVLNNVLLEATDDTLLVSATDIRVSIQTEVPAKVLEEGMTTIPARKLADIVKDWQGDDVHVEVEDNRMRLHGVFGIFGEIESKAKYVLSGIDPEDFPEVPIELDGIDLVIGQDGADAAVLLDMINKTVFSISDDDARAYLNGVLWRIDLHGMEMVATDGNRLSCFRLDLDLSDQLEPGQEASIIVPPGTLGTMVNLLTDYKDDVSITVGERQLLVRLGTTCLVSRLIEGPYVNYAQVIPQDNTKELVVSKELFLPAVRRVSILSSSFTRQIGLKISSGKMMLHTSSPESGGEAEETIPAQYSGDDLELSYNSQFLIDVLRRIDSDEVCIHLSNHVTAAIVTPSTQLEGQDYFCLLMPLRPEADKPQGEK